MCESHGQPESYSATGRFGQKSNVPPKPTLHHRTRHRERQTDDMILAGEGVSHFYSFVYDEAILGCGEFEECGADESAAWVHAGL